MQGKTQCTMAARAANMAMPMSVAIVARMPRARLYRPAFPWPGQVALTGAIAAGNKQREESE